LSSHKDKFNQNVKCNQSVRLSHKDKFNQNVRCNHKDRKLHNVWKEDQKFNKHLRE
jgi:hypothetical protein